MMQSEYCWVIKRCNGSDYWWDAERREVIGPIRNSNQEARKKRDPPHAIVEESGFTCCRLLVRKRAAQTAGLHD